MMAFRTLPRGGWRRAVCIALAVGTMTAAAVPVVRLWQETTAHEWRLLGLGTLARARLAAGAEKHALQRYEWSAGKVAPMPLGTVAADPEIDWTRARILGIAGEAGWRGLGAGCAGGLAALVLLAGWRHSIYGGAAERPPARGGGRPARRPPARRSGSFLGRMALPLLAAMPRRAVRIAGIRYPKEAGRGHTLVVGAAGSGRQALIADLVAGVRAQGGRCIVLDRTGEYTRRLFDPARDALLNPLDTRSVAWSPFCDGRGRGDFEAMAAALIPDPADAGGAVAALAARQLFVEAAEALRRRGDAGGGALADLLFDPAPGELACAAAGMHPDVLLPARALLRRHLAALRFAPGGGFSIRDWVARGNGLLFLASPDDPNGRLRGLASAWLEIALGAILSLDPDGGCGLWMAVDGPEALHRLPSLLPSLGEARGVGVRFAVGIEALGLLRARYGADGAGTVRGLCATRVALAAADEETAAWSSAAIGSESLAPVWRLRRLAPGEGVLRFPGRRDAVAFSLKDSRAGEEDGQGGAPAGIGRFGEGRTRGRRAARGRPRLQAQAAPRGALDLMVASIGAVASPSQGAHYYEADGYYAKDSPEHLAASAWAGKGAAELGLQGPVDPDTFKAVLEGEVPDGSERRLGKRGKDGEIHHRPGRDLTFSAPKSVSLAALVGGDARIVEAHDRAVGRALGWFEKNAAETRMQDRATGRMVRTGNQKTVIATFRHETSRNLDPALHTHSVIANMLLGPDGKWRTMANERLYASKMLLGAFYRNELAGELGKLGYGIERTHADGRFEIAGVERHIIDAYSSRRAEIEAAMEGRGLGSTAENQHLARRAALMTRAAKRDVDRAELRETWEKQAAALGFDAKGLVAAAMERGLDGAEKARGGPKEAGKDAAPESARQPDLFDHAARSEPAREAVDWALAHLAERDAVFARTDLLAAALAFSPGAASMTDIEAAVAGLEREGRLHDAPAFENGGGLTTDRAVADEREAVALMRAGAGRGKAPMKGWTVDRHLRKGPLTAGQKDAVKLILSEKDRTVGVQGYAGTGKTRMLNRTRALAEKKGWRMVGLAPSASAVQTLAAESGIESETLQRFLARNAGVAEGRLTKKGARAMRAAFAKTVLVVDEGSLASTVQARDLLRIASELRIPKLVLVGDAKQLDAVDAGKPFAQLQQAGMKTAVMDEILRQRDPDLKAAVEASLAGEIGRAFEKLGSNVAEVKADNIAGAVAARWLKLSADERGRTGVMAPSHALREGINGHIRERLVREGRIAGPALETQRLVSKGYTNAEKALASNYAPGDVVAFHRPYKRLGVGKGDERRVESVDRKARTVHIEGPDGATVAWKPSEIGGRKGGTEVYWTETVELRAGDRIRWTRNDTGLGVVNSGAAEVQSIRNGRVTFALEDGRRLTLTPGDPQLRHLDRAWASTVHAWQGRTVDNVIAAMEANHPNLTTAKAFYVEISRARDRAELVTDDAQALKERLEAVTGEPISALEGIGESLRPERERRHGKDREASHDRERERPEASAPGSAEREIEPEASRAKAPEPEPPAKGKVREMDLGL